jgi:hypothetical protein
MKLPELPEIRLSNGLVVANYSSPHPFTFVDGSVLPACSKERATLTKLDVVERSFNTKYTISNGTSVKVEHVMLEWKLTWFLEQEVNTFVKMHHMNRIPWHVVLVPLPFMIACKEYIQHAFRDADVPFKVIRVADRITKEIHIDKFYVV